MYKWIDSTSSDNFNLQDALENWNGLRIDPYLVWAYTTDFKYLEVEYQNNEKLLPLIIELKDVYSREKPHDTRTLEDLLDGCDALPFHRLLPKTKYLTVRMPESKFFTLVQSKRLAGLIERIELGLAAKSAFDENEMSPNVADVISDPLRTNLPEEAVDVEDDESDLRPIVGIIDDGVAFLNQRFQDASQGTRIQVLWDQNSVADDDKVASNDAEVSTHGAKHGRVFLKRQIDELIQECYDGDATYPSMEERIYAREKIRGLTRTVSHGTHLLDVAAGANPQTVPPDHDQEIVAVQLPQPDRQFSDTSGNWLKISAFQALQFILVAANQVSLMNRPMRPNRVERDLVVNLSFGNMAGPHDGSSVLEQGIDFLIESAPELANLKSLSVHIAAGNQRQAQCHAKTKVSKDNPATLNWRILPDDSTPSYLEIWFDDEADVRNLSIEIKPPVSTTVGDVRDTEFSVGAGLCHVLKDGNTGTPVCTYLSLPKEKNATGDKTLVLLAIAPTSLGSSTTHAPAGVWDIVISNRSITPYKVSAWIQRDESRSGSPIRGRQSYFDDPLYARRDALGYPTNHDHPQEGYASQTDSINAIATGEQVTTVGAYRYSGRETVDYSGYKNELADDERVDRFIHAIAEDSLTCPGVIAAGSRSGSRIALNGTSVANAVATRHRYEKGSFDAGSVEQTHLKDVPDLERKKLRVGVKKSQSVDYRGSFKNIVS